jgi:hypothetical protein
MPTAENALITGPSGQTTFILTPLESMMFDTSIKLLEAPPNTAAGCKKSTLIRNIQYPLIFVLHL